MTSGSQELTTDHFLFLGLPNFQMMSSQTTTLDHVPIPSTDPTHFVDLISNLLTPSECDQIITTHTNLQPSNITLGTIREREVFTDFELARLLWSRMSYHYDGYRVKDMMGDWWVAKGLNEQFRLSRYAKGGRFTAHFDYPRSISLNAQTFLSVNIYLNSIPENLGGATRILKHSPDQGDYWDGFEELKVIAKIQPVQGCASVFRETLWHDGEELLGGEKWLLRTDVVFEREEVLNLDAI